MEVRHDARRTRHDVVKIDPPRPARRGTHPVPMPRDAGDIALLCSLAASHSLFGRHDVAARFLALAAWIDPTAPRVLELSAVIEMRRGRIGVAQAAIERLRTVGDDLPSELSIVEQRAAAWNG